MTKRCVLYARVSSDDRAKTGGANLQGQLDLCREYAQRQGYTIIAELAEDDRGAKGAEFDLPQLSKALDMARSGEYDIFVCRELDRLARNIAKQFLVEDELKRSKIKVEYSLYDFPPTPEGQLQKGMFAAFADYERTKISQRTERGKLRRVKEGNVMTFGLRPYGYQVVKENNKVTLAIDEEEATVVRLIYNWYVAGEGGCQAIANRLTDMQILTGGDKQPAIAQKKQQQPGCWNAHNVHNILTSELYVGVWHYGKESEKTPIPVAVPAIIDLETWEAAQTRRKTNQAFARRNTKRKYLMQQRLRCAVCGKKMVAFTNAQKGERPYYCCPAHNKGYFAEQCTQTKNFRADLVDSAVWEWLCEKFQDEEALSRAIDEEQAERETKLLPRRQELESVVRLITTNEAGRDRVKKLFYNGHITEEELLRDKQPYESALANLRKEQTRLETLIAEGELTDEVKRTIIESARDVRDGIDEAQENFAKRRELVDILDLNGKLGLQEKDMVLNLHCVVGDDTLIVSRGLCARSS